MLDDRVFTFLEIASRETTSEPEALNALRHFRKVLDSRQIDLRDYISSSPATPGAPLSLTKYKQKVSSLEGELEATTLERDSLLASNLTLTRQLKQAEKQVRVVQVEHEEEDETSFEAFNRTVTTKVGKKWRAIMLAQTRYTYTDFRNWEIDKKAPPEAFACIAELRAVQGASFKWDENPTAVQRVFELKNSGVPTKDIAVKLSAELGVELKPTAIKYCIQLKKAA